MSPRLHPALSSPLRPRYAACAKRLCRPPRDGLSVGAAKSVRGGSRSPNAGESCQRFLSSDDEGPGSRRPFLPSTPKLQEMNGGRGETLSCCWVPGSGGSFFLLLWLQDSHSAARRGLQSPLIPWASPAILENEAAPAFGCSSFLAPQKGPREESQNPPRGFASIWAGGRGSLVEVRTEQGEPGKVVRGKESPCKIDREGACPL